MNKEMSNAMKKNIPNASCIKDVEGKFKVLKSTVDDIHSCNCCKKGTLTDDSKGLDIPYNEVISLRVGQSVSTLCVECYDQLRALMLGYDELPEIENNER